mmetsp:Transcript_13872/g.23001  ORF Transcript_13872/g.23001 Transcript_13872/m.23001 type:complete len:913 (+) Transcript_13872:184-2922(+)|eukprot:CAMPEP_0119324216 /NCGR_PEP_ID=MMETSP1333-20130426/62613_1 /TAXON_ID=418940 /ORGANISM="Scyphosphaera apsteinii, Strain RCC1455" /LENGTH=912 /DNA_ID=CAMNT_0007331863 /DNA_START=188 /DNA_END=2926 /DNA_ORIENTATION=-
MGNAESQPVKSVDKRTARRDNGPQFSYAISRWRAMAAVEPPATAFVPRIKASRLRVCVRRRPIFTHEIDAGEFDVLSCRPRCLTIHDCRLKSDCKSLVINHTTFHFNRVFDDHSSSEAVYSTEVAPLVRLAANSPTPCCVLMYGQTGSGKSYTMNALQGPLADELFSLVGAGDTVSVSFAELSGLGARDLLNAGASCQLLTDHSGEVQLVPSIEVPVDSAANLRALFAFGSALRATAATGVNTSSSRSHALFRISVQRQDEAPGCVGSLTLCDLAGSEQRIDSTHHDAARAKESAAINASLMALKECVSALARGGSWRAAGGRHPLTQLLKSSFVDERALTLVLVMVSPASKDTEHTLNTLRHASIMDGQSQPAAHADGSHVRGGEVHTEQIGEADVRLMRAKLKAEAIERQNGGIAHGGGPGFALALRLPEGRQQQNAEAEFKKLERQALRALSSTAIEQHAALVDERKRAASGPALNRFQYQRLRYRVLQQQRAADNEQPPADQAPELGHGVLPLSISSSSSPPTAAQPPANVEGPGHVQVHVRAPLAGNCHPSRLEQQPEPQRPFDILKLPETSTSPEEGSSVSGSSSPTPAAHSSSTSTAGTPQTPQTLSSTANALVRLLGGGAPSSGSACNCTPTSCGSCETGCGSNIKCAPRFGRRAGDPTTPQPQPQLDAAVGARRFGGADEPDSTDAVAASSSNSPPQQSCSARGPGGQLEAASDLPTSDLPRASEALRHMPERVAGPRRRPSAEFAVAPPPQPSAAALPSASAPTAELPMSRWESAATKRTNAEEARKEALLHKLQERARRSSTDHYSEITRIETQLAQLADGPAAEATRLGLRKQLAVHRGALLREERKHAGQRDVEASADKALPAAKGAREQAPEWREQRQQQLRRADMQAMWQQQTHTVF